MTKRLALLIACLPISCVIALQIAIKYGTWIYPAYVAIIMGFCLYKMVEPDTKGE